MHTYEGSASVFGLLLICAAVMIVVAASLVFIVEQGSYTVSKDFPSGAYIRITLNQQDQEISPFISVRT